MPQQRSSTAVWIALALIAACIACVAFGMHAVRTSTNPATGLTRGVFALYVVSLVGSGYFIIRLGFAGLMIVFGRPINRTVAWSSSSGALLHCATLLAVLAATIVFAPPQGFELVAIGVAIGLIALYVMGQYPNLAETQGWDVAEPEVATRAKSSSAPPVRPASVATRPVVTPVISPAIVTPPISTEAPRAAGSSNDDRAPSLLR